jgi:hypothetical protein
MLDEIGDVLADSFSTGSQLGPHKGGPGPHVGPETDRGSVPANFAEPPSGYAASG